MTTGGLAPREPMLTPAVLALQEKLGISGAMMMPAGGGGAAPPKTRPKTPRSVKK